MGVNQDVLDRIVADHVVPVSFVIDNGLLEDSYVQGKIENQVFSDKKTPFSLYNAKGRQSYIIDYYVLKKPKVDGCMLFKLTGIKEPLISFPLSSINIENSRREILTSPIKLKANSNTAINLRTMEIGLDHAFVQTVYFHIVSYPTRYAGLSRKKDGKYDQ